MMCIVHHQVPHPLSQDQSAPLVPLADFSYLSSNDSKLGMIGSGSGMHCCGSKKAFRLRSKQTIESCVFFRK